MIDLSLTMKEIAGRVDLPALYPPFADLWLEVLSNLEARHQRFYAISGKRSLDEQKAAWARGRKEVAPGQWVVADEQKVVTNARPGLSAHNYAIAGDACRDKDRDLKGLQPDWSLPDYEVYAEECRRIGLDAAYYWTSFCEGPHAQLDLRRYGISTWKLFQLHEQGGMPEVWGYLDSFTWKR